MKRHIFPPSCSRCSSVSVLKHFISVFVNGIPAGIRFFLSLFLSLQLSGCSLVGLGVGAIIDSKKPNQRSFPGWQVNEIKPKSDAKLTLRTDSVITGRYMGFYAVRDEEYAAAYTTAKKLLDFLPALGDTIGIVGLSGSDKNGIMRGFDRLSVLYLYSFYTEKNTKKITVSSKRQLNSIEKIIGPKSGEISGTVLCSLGLAGEIPYRSRILMKVRKDTLSVPLKKVSRIDVKVKKHAWRNLLIAGVILDALLIVGLATSGPWGPSW